MIDEEFLLAASTADLADEPAARNHADVVEFRLDLADDGLSQLEGYDGDLPLLVTNRVEWEGGAAADTQARLDALERAVGLDAVVGIDVELDAVEAGDAHPLVDAARDAGVAVVVSTHDFDGTPDEEQLRSLLTAACEAGDVGKLAVTARDRADVLDLLAVTHSLHTDGLTVATMAMGAPGRHSRAVAPLYGSKLGYAPVDPAAATAPGQYDLETLRSLVSRLQDE